MRTVFLGTPDFAVPSLHALLDHPDITVALVVTQPDRPAGRGRSLTSPPVKTVAAAAGVPIYQPESLRAPEAVEQLRAARPDLLVVVAYGQLLRRAVLELAPHGCINVHPSLLPRYRGATPIPAAILNGDLTTGVSVIRLERRLDAGPIVAQWPIAIEHRDTTGTLGARLALSAAAMLPAVALNYAAGLLEPRAQDESLATYTRELTPADARINWSLPAIDIDRLVRAAHPWPVAWTMFADARIRIVEVADDPTATDIGTPGTIDQHANPPRVATGDGWLRLIAVQPPGGRAMPAADWLRGTRLMSTQFTND